MPIKKQQLELDIEQQTGSKLGKEYVKAVYCHPAYLAYMQNTSSSVCKESSCNSGDPSSISGSGRCWRMDRLPTPVFLGFPCDSAGKESACNVGDLGSISGLGRSPGEGNDYPLQYSDLENLLDCIIHAVTKSQTGVSDFHFTLCLH